jgi:hypothetical protein
LDTSWHGSGSVGVVAPVAPDLVVVADGSLGATAPVVDVAVTALDFEPDDPQELMATAMNATAMTTTIRILIFTGVPIP